VLFNMRPSVLVSQDAMERLKQLQEIHALVRIVLHVHKDEMQARLELSSTPHFVRGDKESRNLFLRG
jgi:hypothetical protein